jgi:hypothetical protein
MRSLEKAWIEVVDEGEGEHRPGVGTGRRVVVFLVIDADGQLTRFKLPNVISVDYHADAKTYPVLTLCIGNAHVRAHVAISPGKSSAEDLLSEIAAARITQVDEP